MSDAAKNQGGGMEEADGGEAALRALMAGYLDGWLEAFGGLYAALAGRLRG